MKLDEYLKSLPVKRKLSDVKIKILTRLWGDDLDSFPKPWVSSAELLELTEQKYFDRRARELEEKLGCDVVTSYHKEFGGHAWRINSVNLSPPQDREYLTKAKKNALFERYDHSCSACATNVPAGDKGLQADHKVPLSRGGNNDLGNWQPLCVNCNVGKRRACEGCQLDCNACSWAFPEIFGVKTMLSISEKTLRRVDAYTSLNGHTRDKVMEAAAEYFLDAKEKLQIS